MLQTLIGLSASMQWDLCWWCSIEDGLAIVMDDGDQQYIYILMLSVSVPPYLRVPNCHTFGIAKIGFGSEPCGFLASKFWENYTF